MKTLTLNLKKQWYEMIESGEKKEEYREIKPFWMKRLMDANDPDGDGASFKKFDQVKFVYGYTKRTMTFDIAYMKVATGNMKWGAIPGEVYYVIGIGKRVE